MRWQELTVKMGRMGPNEKDVRWDLQVVDGKECGNMKRVEDVAFWVDKRSL